LAIPYRGRLYTGTDAAGVSNEVIPDLAGGRVHHRLTHPATEGVLELGMFDITPKRLRSGE
jgi:hypothetical protein